MLECNIVNCINCTILFNVLLIHLWTVGTHSPELTKLEIKNLVVVQWLSDCVYCLLTFSSLKSFESVLLTASKALICKQANSESMHTPYPGGFFYQTSTSRTLSPALTTAGLGVRLLAFCVRRFYTQKLVEVMEFQLSYFQVLTDDVLKVLHSICQQIWKTQQDWKMSVFVPIPKKGNAKNVQATV